MMSAKTKEDLTFESAMLELEGVTQRLESAKDTLEESICLYERGVFLKDFCEKQLKSAEEKWTLLKKNKDDIIEEVELSQEEKRELMPSQTQANNPDLF